jgi:hypothetical protein
MSIRRCTRGALLTNIVLGGVEGRLGARGVRKSSMCTGNNHVTFLGGGHSLVLNLDCLIKRGLATLRDLLCSGLLLALGSSISGDNIRWRWRKGAN